MCARQPRRADGPPRAYDSRRSRRRRAFGVLPASIPDYLALVGDTSDGYPGLPGWGAKSAAAVLARYHHLENIPEDYRTWGVNASSPARLSRVLAESRDDVFLFRTLATLRTDVYVFETVDDLRWQGPTPAFAPLAARLDRAAAAAAAASKTSGKPSSARHVVP